MTLPDPICEHVKPRGRDTLVGKGGEIGLSQSSNLTEKIEEDQNKRKYVEINQLSL